MKEKKDNKKFVKEANYKEFIPNQETVDAIEEGRKLLNHPEKGAKNMKEFWSDLL